MVHRWSDCAVPRTESVTWPRESSDRSRGRGEPVRLQRPRVVPDLVRTNSGYSRGRVQLPARPNAPTREYPERSSAITVDYPLLCADPEPTCHRVVRWAQQTPETCRTPSISESTSETALPFSRCQCSDPPDARYSYPIFFRTETCPTDRACDTRRIRLIGGRFHYKARMVARRSDLPGVSALVCR
jgi:hypothetical protein